MKVKRVQKVQMGHFDWTFGWDILMIHYEGTFDETF